MAHFRFDRVPRRLVAPVPDDVITPVGDQLAAALTDSKVSQRELARRLAGRGAGATAVESKRRWVQKVLAGEVEEPSMGAVERALELPAGHFVITPRAARRERREALEDEVSDLRDSVGLLLQVSTVLAGEVLKLGGEVPAEMREALARAATRRPL